MGVGMIRTPLPLSTEQIYDALFDDDAFRLLPDKLARLVGARSAALAWRYQDGSTEVLQHNGYFSDAQFADYAAHYADSDPWIPIAYRPGRMNTSIRMDEEIDSSSVRRTAFYNDWLRGMGDDTLHCLGAATSMPDGDGIIGLQRGAGTTGAFTQAEAARLEHVLPHVCRVLVLRGRLATVERQTHSIQSAFDATGLAMIVLDAAGRVCMTNRAGDAALASGGWLDHGPMGVLNARPMLANSVALATQSINPSASAALLTRVNGDQLVANVIPFATLPNRRDAMIVFQPPANPWIRRSMLQHLFGLTAAEVEVGLSLAEGAALPAIAARRGTTIDTVRAQLRVIRHKTGCTRQAELVALLNRLTPQ